MFANSTDISTGRRQRGFTMAELLMVIVILGVVSAVVAPKLQGAVSLRDEAWRDQVQAALRYGQKSALAHRRLVCATVGSTSITLNIASANPASSCNSSLKGPDGTAVFATSSDSAAATAVSPSGVIYFQPDGRVTTDGAGTTVSNRTISMNDVSNLTLIGETGHVE